MILSISLMAFILVLLLSLSSLLQLEIGLAMTHKRQTTARQNALFGLNVALGKLQVLAGPDQRITAPGGVDVTSAMGKQHWTGVWHSKSSGGVADNFDGWLVSLPNGDDKTLAIGTLNDIAWTFVDEEWTVGSNNWVVLVGDGSVESTGSANNHVAAGRLPITTDVGSQGNYAFWVGEENTKARVNLSVPTSVDLADDTDIGRLLSPRYTGFTSLEEDAFASLTSDDSRLARLNQIGELVALSSDDDVGRRYFHDLTTQSQGVIANVQSGGLKKDLTHLFEHNGAFTRQFGDAWSEDYVFIPDEASITFSYGGPNWDILRSFYRLHEKVTGNAIMPIPADDEQRKRKTGNTYRTEEEGYQKNQPVHALLSWIRLGISVEYRSETNESGQEVYYPRLHLKPLVALYNPYDIPLLATSYYVDWSFNPRVTIQLDGKDAIAFRIQEAIPRPNENFDTRFHWLIDGDTDLRPGETRYYALNDVFYIGDSSVGQMSADWNENGAYYIDFTRDEAVAVASSRGSTSTLQPPEGADSSNRQSPAFGLTVSERSDLEFVLAPGDLLPSVTVEVSYSPSNNSDGSSGTSLDLWLKVGGSNLVNTSTYGGAIFQEFDSNMRPDDVSISYDSIGQLVGAAVDVSALGFGLRTTGNIEDAHRQLIDANPRAVLLSNWEEGYRGGKGLNSLSGWAVYEYTIGAFDLPINDLDRFSGFWGNTRDYGGVGSVVLFHVPREPLVSLGQFQHANLGRYARDPAYVVGNSYAIARIDTDKTAAEPFFVESDRTHYAYDWSYVVNDQLWDDYYFSTVPQNLTDPELAMLLTREDTLPNSRLSFHDPEGLDVILDNLTDPNDPDTASRMAAMQMTEGPFNVNSVSVPAWKAFLGSNAGLSIPVYNPETGAVLNQTQENGAIFFRTPVSYDSGFETTQSGSNFWNAYRTLTDDELTDLAQAMVSEVQARGPFSSVADFVNRRLSGPPEQRRRSALQAALDTTINQKLVSDLVGPGGSSLSIPDYSGDTLNPEDRQGSGMPGWILQGDVLQVLGPLVVVRSDTFRIRAYGDQINQIGDVVARAWCEAVVQRVPDYVDPGNLPHEPVYAPDGSVNVSSINKMMGRQFRIVSFRWLSPDEV